MRKGICPKCGKEEIYKSYFKSSIDSGIRAGENQLIFNFREKKEGFFGDKFKFGHLEYCACAGCGLLEIYIPETAEPEKIKTSANWIKVEKT
jgi:hypothetical protein